MLGVLAHDTALREAQHVVLAVGINFIQIDPDGSLQVEDERTGRQVGDPSSEVAGVATVDFREVPHHPDVTEVRVPVPDNLRGEGQGLDVASGTVDARKGLGAAELLLQEILEV